MKVTVLLPVYNAEKYLQESLESILSQTYSDFDVLIINDGSTDRSEEIIKSFQDKRIRLVQNDSNRGLVYTLNKGIEQTDAEIIVRMDADDIARPNRVEELVKFLEANPDHWLVYSQVKYFGQENYISCFPENHLEIKASLLFGNSVAHPAVAFRVDYMKAAGLLYESDFLHTEDYRLWSKVIVKGKFKCLDFVLLDYRLEGQNISVRNRSDRFLTVQHIFRDLFESYGWKISSEQLRMHGILTDMIPFDKDDISPFCSYVRTFQEFFNGNEIQKEESALILDLFKKYFQRKYFVQDKDFKRMIFREGNKWGWWTSKEKIRYYLGL